MESGLLSHLVTLQLLFRVSSLPVLSTLSQEYIIVFFGAYADPAVAHRGLEALINLSRRGGTRDEALALYKKLLSQGDGEPKQLPFDMLKFLTQRLHLYTIQL